MNKNDLITSEIVIENIRCHIYNVEDNNSIKQFKFIHYNNN